jgi:RNA polymerase sigma-70 factor (ECF subfamily)
MGWACEVARYEVLAWVRDKGRDRLLFDAELIESVAIDAGRKANNAGKLSLFLDQCLALCSDRDRDLIQKRYASGGSVKAMAAERNEPAGRIAVVLCRIRRNLMACVERKLAAEAGS